MSFMLCIYCFQSGFTCYVFICAYTPMKYQIKLSNAPDIMSTCDMKKHLRRKKLPAGIKSFQRLELKNESSPYVVYFALFHSKRYVSGGGFSLQNIFKEKEPDCWSLDKLPPHGPDCLSFFFTGDYLKLEKKKRELEQKKRELKQRKIQLLEWQVQTHTADGMTVEPDQTTLAGLTTLTNECNILEREIRSLKITKSPHPDEDSRTQELFQSLSDQKAFSGLHSSLHQRTYHEPPSFSSDICLHSGGCDILFYSDKAAAINVSIPVEVSDSKGECSGCSSTEHKLLPNTDHEEQLSAEGYVMASRLLYYRIVNGLRPDTVTRSSVYAALFEVAGSIIIRKYKLNFLTQLIEQCDKLVLPMTEDNLSISIQQLINKTKKVTNKSFYCLY